MTICGGRREPRLEAHRAGPGPDGRGHGDEAGGIVDDGQTSRNGALSLLRIRADVREDGVWLVLEGEFDIAGVAAAERTLAEVEAGGAHGIVIDLTDLEFLDSSAVRTLVSASERSRELGRPLAIVTGSGPAERLFRILGLEKRLRTVERPGATGA